ncbi:hypothetical protein MNBD_NITROSPINAE02-2148 [hydrothermal vent metagenome]|uniref:Uncharacterized protein n=1 Tax=hydrothermal vent metagenome TaxID=652676 RepID=A0A3B1C108_9ZZZZ
MYMKTLWWAVWLNCMGTLLFVASLYVASPLSFIVTFAFGSIFIIAAIVVWGYLVINEAAEKGMFS